MKIVYTEHLKTRIRARHIPYQLPREIVNTAKERYRNAETEHDIAIGKARYAGKLRLMLVVYDKMGEDKIEIITIHPVERSVIDARVGDKRFIKI